MQNLIWAAQLSEAPISICRSNLNGLPGAICTLSENGRLDVSYLGSDPQLFQVPPLNLQKLNFEKTQTELIELEKEIKKGVDFSDVSMINATAEKDLNVDITIGSTLEQCTYRSKISTMVVPSDDLKMISVNVSLHAKTALEQIQVQFNYSPPLRVNNQIQSYHQMLVNQSEQITAWFYMDDNCDITSTIISVVVSFINKQTIPRVIEKSTSLPLSMFYKLFLPQKESSIKLTIDVKDGTAPSLDQIFANDFHLESTSSAIGLKSIYSSKTVTVVMAKSSNRYRIQSDHLPSIAAILEVLIQRIEKKQESKIRLMATPPLPINALITHIDSHYNCYIDVQRIREELKQCAIRMRLLERRYFAKLDDKKLGSTVSISIFIKSTHDELLQLIQSLEKSKQDLSK